MSTPDARTRRSVVRTHGAQLPPLYAPWITAALGGPIPEEQAATCGTCAMLAPAAAKPGASAEGLLHFDARSKCCTYVPTLPNYLVGRILRDPSPTMAAGRASVTARLAHAATTTPLGLDAPPAFTLLYGAGGAATFGRAVDLRCPHYLTDSGGCGIWAHRQSVCATWFCKYDRGEVGQRFWAALRHLLDALERALVVHCVRTLEPGVAALRLTADRRLRPVPAVTAGHLGADGEPDVTAVWGRYAGRQAEYFGACAELVEAMAWTDVLRAGGAEVALAADLAAAAYDALVHPARPVAPRASGCTVMPGDGASSQVVGYSGYDPLELPTSLVQVLHVFDGRPTRQAPAAARGAGVGVAVQVVRRLVDFGILVDTAAGA